MDDKLSNLISALGVDENITGLKSLLENSKTGSKSGDCRKERDEMMQANGRIKFDFKFWR